MTIEEDILHSFPVPAGYRIKILNENQPCSHTGCLHHISHPCEGCGRIGGKGSSFEYAKIKQGENK